MKIKNFFLNKSKGDVLVDLKNHNIKFKIPKTADLWTPEQILQLKDFYISYNPNKLEKQLFDRIIHQHGPSSAKQLLINIYSNPLSYDFKPNALKKIMQINIVPYEFTLKKHTILYHYSPHMLPFIKIKSSSLFKSTTVKL